MKLESPSGLPSRRLLMYQTMLLFNNLKDLIWGQHLLSRVLPCPLRGQWTHRQRRDR